jgi:pimeloyl-ACP methyl ester carboxylesterase
MKANQTKTVVFVTGAFVHHSGWNQWKAYFEEKGYTTLNPAWPFKDASVQELRDRQPNDTGLANLRLDELVEHYAKIVRALPEKPILIGHSYGGLIVQKLVEQGLGVAGIPIHSVPPQGTFTFKWSFYKSTWGALGLFTSVKKTYLMPFSTWQYAFTNGMKLEDQQKAYDENTIPESKRTTRDGLGSMAKIDFKKPHAPLLFVAGTDDHIMPASLNYSNYKRYIKGNSGSVTDFIELPNRNHFVLGLPNWKETADVILDWIAEH